MTVQNVSEKRSQPRYQHKENDPRKISRIRTEVLPAIRDIDNANEPRLVEIRQTSGGDYAYSLGFVKNQKLIGIRRIAKRGQARNVVLADAPVGNLVRNEHVGIHGRGQNVLFADGRAAFLATRVRPGSSQDDIYQNDHGFVRPGLHEEDAVLAPAAARMVFVANK